MIYLLCIAFTYITGIFFYNLTFNFNYLIYLLIATLTLSIIEYKLKNTKIFLLISLALISFVTGAKWYQISLPKPQNNDLLYYAPQKNITIEGIVTDEPKKDENKISFKIKSEYITSPYIALSAGNAIVNIYTTDLNLEYGDKIQVTGDLDLPPKAPNPGEFSYQQYLVLQDVFSFITAKQIDVIEKDTKSDFKSLIIGLRKKLLANLYKSMPEDSAAIIGSLVFGAKATPVSREIRDDFTNLGLAHVLAASGMQISLIMSTGLLLIRFTGVNRLIGISLIIPTIIFYMLLTGMPPSILRAGLLNIIILLVQYKRESPNTYKLLFLVSFLILIFNPLVLYDIGFQFSVLATLGLLYISKPLEDKLTFLPVFIASVIAMILSAQLMVLPLQLYHFGQFSYLFLPANLIASLFVDVLTYLSIISISLGFILPFISNLLGIIIYYLLTIFIGILDYLSLLPYSISYLKRPEVLTVLFWYLVIIFLTEVLKENIITTKVFKKKKMVTLLFSQILVLLLLFYNSFKETNQLVLTFLNIGQGDSTLIKTPENKYILVDCGNTYNFNKDGKEIKYNAAEKYIFPYLKHNGIHTIDKLVLTHPDLDHIGGCESIINNFNILEIMDSGQISDSKPYNDLLKTIVTKNIPLKVANHEDKYLEKDFKMEVINKIDTQNLDLHSYSNNNAIALKIEHGTNSFLLTSDLEKEAEFKLIEEGADLNSLVYKVGHHGSLTSSTDDFMLRVRPKISIISCGKNNRYGHPRDEVIERLNYFGSEIYRTDTDGGILVSSNGQQLNVSTSD